MKRVRWEVAPSRIGFGWQVTRNGDPVQWTIRKGPAVSLAASLCAAEWKDYKIRSELYIKGRNGQIEDARTYGEDPRKTKG